MITIPLIVCLLGLIIYMVTNHPKVSELSRICFAFGLLVVLLNTGKALF